MSFKLSNEAKAEKFIIQENDKDVRKIDIHLEEVLHLVETLVDTFNFAPANTLHSGFI